MNRKFTMGPVGPVDSKGQPYLTLIGSTIKAEGAGYGAAASDTMAEAWGMFLTGAAREFKDATHVEFRILPTYEEDPASGRCYVRCRFSVLERKS